ncbi:chromosomal replication initiator protein DnaA [Engelhardtia mirabilis]|uniref:chromosomal replication initiator protein DnaA n=1 Tax=Engelhardtia mirabilis TaxID=2528011 RepID=UPI003AF385EF
MLQTFIQREQFDTWFRRAELRGLDAKTATVAVQNGFTRYFIANFYTDVLERAVSEVVGSSREVIFEVDAELTITPRRAMPPTGDGPAPPAHASGAAAVLPPSPETPIDGIRAASTQSRQRGAASPRRTDGPEQPDRPSTGQTHTRASFEMTPAPRRHRGLLSASDVGLNPGYRFDAFVVGPCNRFAHAAAVGVSESPGQQYNPFFMHGNVGLGKTHLMQSLCHALLERNPDVRILYLSCETFVNHFISALENGDLHEFRNKYRNVDVLVVDDIHLLANKERTQEEFFHTFNTLYNAGKQIVLSSDSPPKDIPTLQGRLVSRFKWGLVTEMEPPCYETRMAILKRKSRERGHELPEEVARLLAEHIDTNIRELEGAVTKVLGYAALAQRPVSEELARECLSEVFDARPSAPNMEDVLRVVTQHFSMRLSDIQSRKRTAAIAYARQVGMYLARRVTRLSLEEIGGYFGGRDHSTVLYAIQKITRLSKTDAECLSSVRELQRQLDSPASR